METCRSNSLIQPVIHQWLLVVTYDITEPLTPVPDLCCSGELNTTSRLTRWSPWCPNMSPQCPHHGEDMTRLGQQDSTVPRQQLHSEKASPHRTTAVSWLAGVSWRGQHLHGRSGNQGAELLPWNLPSHHCGSALPTTSAQWIITPSSLLKRSGTTFCPSWTVLSTQKLAEVQRRSALTDQ